jgi:microcin C transport system substrate-binding protein
MQGFVYNIRRAVFQDRRVRRAICHAFDFEWANKNLFYGAYTRTKSYFSNSELASRGLPGPDEPEGPGAVSRKVLEEVFTRNTAAGHRRFRQHPRRRPRKPSTS